LLSLLASMAGEDLRLRIGFFLLSLLAGLFRAREAEGEFAKDST